VQLHQSLVCELVYVEADVAGAELVRLALSVLAMQLQLAYDY